MYARISSKIINISNPMNETAFKSAVSFISDLFNDHSINYRIVKDIPTKTKFANISIIVDKDDSAAALYCMNKYAHDFERCANVYSYLMDDKIHADIIIADKDDFDTMSFLLDYDNFGWLIQRCMQKHHNYILTDSGLYFKYHAHYKEYLICLTKDIKTILNICQLDYDRYLKGFTTYDDIFHYVAECPIFDQRLFDIKHMPKREAAKFKKHTFYKKLNKFNNLYDIPVTIPGKLIGPFDMFMEKIESEIEVIEATRAAVVKLKNHFNGNIVQSITGLNQPELGIFMKGIRQKYTDDELIANAIEIINTEYTKGICNGSVNYTE